MSSKNFYWNWDFEEGTSSQFTESHFDFRRKMRNFVEQEIIPFVDEWEEEGTYPRELHQKAYAAGVYGACWPAELGGTPPKNFDIFHEFVFWDEISRACCGGVFASCFYTQTIGLPPVISEGLAGGPELTRKIAREVVTGEKIIALAVTEPSGGSDVAAIETTADFIKDPSGDYYLVTGNKTLITSGPRADYFTTAVRTDKGISLLLIPRHSAAAKGKSGFTVERLKTQGWKSSGTARLTFDGVVVPADYLIGRLGGGFKPIMVNFNHERLTGNVACNRYCRELLEEAIIYARQRKTFGKPLIKHQVIRHKLAEMARRIIAQHALNESIFAKWKAGIRQDMLSGPIALAKVNASKNFEFCAREASQIFGGKAFLIGGRGGKVERLYREVRVAAIGGGSEEIMLDLAASSAKL